MSYGTDSDIFTMKANLVFAGAFALVALAAIVCFAISGGVLPAFNFDDLVIAYLMGAANLFEAIGGLIQGLF